MWQALHAELEPQGLTVVTVALDVDPDNARPWIAAATPTHPSLVDSAHVTDELFGFVNVPSAVWIGEDGRLVRPPELASIEPRPSAEQLTLPDEAPERLKRTIEQVLEFEGDPEAYLAAIHDWVERGADSVFALDPDEVVARSRPRPVEHAEAAACFELGRWHWDREERDAAVGWWRRAHELQPDNWTYKRQAWTFETTAPGESPDLLQGPTEAYDGNWLDDVIAQGGGKAYYEAPRL